MDSFEGVLYPFHIYLSKANLGGKAMHWIQTISETLAAKKKKKKKKRAKPTYRPYFFPAWILKHSYFFLGLSITNVSLIQGVSLQDSVFSEGIDTGCVFIDRDGVTSWVIRTR